MSCCHLGKPLASCRLQHTPLTLALAIGGCDDRGPVSVPSATPSVLSKPVRMPGILASGPVAMAAVLWPESASPRLFDPPPRA
jgi:hypothetical protein